MDMDTDEQCDVTLVLVPSAPDAIALPGPPNPTASGSNTPIVIDNGATHFRYGYGTSADPYVSQNSVSKYKDRKTNKMLLLFGAAAEVDAASRGQAKSPWEGDILCNFDALENALDFAFLRLDLHESSVQNPILMTERICTPLHSRALTSELLFECYGVPSVTYAVDSVMSMYHNYPSAPSNDGLAISFGTNSTSVVPVLGGAGIMQHAKRIPWGSAQASEYLLKLVQLKYSSFPTRVTSTQSNWMFRTFCEFATDYGEVLQRLKDPLGMRGADKIIQFPYVLPAADEKTEEELARAAEKRKELGRRLQEQAARVRGEKLLQKELDLQDLLAMKESKSREKKPDYMARLKAEGFESEQALDQTVSKLEGALKRARRREEGLEDEVAEEPTFPMVDIPDDQLDEEGIKEKRKQRLIKAGYEARMRAKQEKQREKEAREEEERKEAEDRERNPRGWAEKLRREYETTIDSMKDRKRRKAALSDRKSAAAQQRMANIASLASDAPQPKRKRKGGHEDLFGANDDDWSIYRKINTGAESDSEDEDVQNLQSVEKRLLDFDPTFTELDTYAYKSTQRSALMAAFRHQYEEGDVRGAHRLHLNVERWRVPETWFTPSMAGVDCAGLGEVMEGVLRAFGLEERHRLVNNVFVTGGPSQMRGTRERLNASLRPILSPEVPLVINKAQDPFLDAWKGMADFTQTDGFAGTGFTRAEYDEWGGDRVRKWWGGNRNMAI